MAAPFDPSILTPEYMEFNNSHEIMSVVIGFTAVAISVLLARFYVRIFMLKVMGLDDVMLLLAMFLSIGCLVCYTGRVQHGLGRHVYAWIMVPGAMVEQQKWTFALSLLVVSGVSTVKVAVGLLLVRLSDRTMYTRFIWGVIIFTICFWFACCMTIVFACVPVAANWDFTLRPAPFGTGTAQCFSLTTFRNVGIFNSSVNMATDVLWATMPIPLIRKLTLGTRVKASLICILGLGYFACAAACVKTVLQWRFFEELDWSVHDSFNVWAVIEFNIGILAAGLPGVKPLFSWLLDTARTITASQRSRTKAHTSYAHSHKLPSTSSQQDPAIPMEYISDKWNSSQTNTTRVDIEANGGRRVSRNNSMGRWGSFSKNPQADSSNDDMTVPLQQTEKGNIVRTTVVNIA